MICIYWRGVQSKIGKVHLVWKFEWSLRFHLFEFQAQNHENLNFCESTYILIMFDVCLFWWFWQVGGIFLIFLWIFVDQLYIQMGVKKTENGGAIPHHHTSLSSIPIPGSVGAVRRKNLMVIDHSSYANSYASLPRPGKVLGVGEVERRQYQNGATPRSKRSRPVVRTKSMSSQM